MSDRALSGDIIRLTGLRIFAHHGVLDFERENGQEFVIDLEIAVDLAPAAASDDVTKTIHYGELAEAVYAAVQADAVDLIETVAERVAAIALRYERADSVTVTIHKPAAPITVPFGDVSVTITRSRPSGSPS
ncbi:dihydroneopterin aldolase [Glaciihabitans sp. INWT7]|uniref:dihydroneopterin aldolase n=1 Tax=Glaciihabitans sp. INWT7 TaxID=2596912 RepID=UPI0016264910|nr:dihydroneopterin aldolase [Glaciihabitans sp. INWT7]QNE48034.1 dihydroneopterin aldolase [Glaciihabitans sp. INWT7]